MQQKELIKQLRRIAVETGSITCFGCGYEHSCGIHGCSIMKEAAEIIEKYQLLANGDTSVKRFLDSLDKQAGSGSGISTGTVYKLRKIAVKLGFLEG